MAPIRGNYKPYLGNKIQDGTTSKHDWQGIVKTKDLPRVVNPRKGFIVTANNRQMPDHVASDHGASITSTVRAQRITELIMLAIEKGHKLDYKDVLEIQNDTVDLMARDMIPHMLKLASSMMGELTASQAEDAHEAMRHLAHWHG